MIDWQAIVDEHGPLVWRTVYRLVSHREDALDCYQETFLQAARYAKTHTVLNWSALLRQMASTRSLDCLRRRYRDANRGALPLELALNLPASEAGPDIHAELNEWIEGLRRALPLLPPRQAEVFCMREIELMSTGDVARQLGVTPDEVATWLHRAKSQLSKVVLGRNLESEIRQ